MAIERPRLRAVFNTNVVVAALKSRSPQSPTAELLRRWEDGILIDVPNVERVIEADPDDDIVLACAAVGNATHLVTYDPHFLPLGEEYRGIRIVNGLHFLYLVRGDVPPQT